MDEKYYDVFHIFNIRHPKRDELKNYLLKNEIDAKNKTITLVYGGISLTEAQKNLIREKAMVYSLDNAKIEFQQGFSFDQLTRKNSEVENLSSELNRLTVLLKKKEEQIEVLSHKNDIGMQILNEIKILYPQIKTCTYAESEIYNVTNSAAKKVQIVIFTTEGRNLYNSEKKKIRDWLGARLKSGSLQIFFDS